MSDSLNQSEAEFVRDLVYRRSAIVLDDSKLYLIESRLHQLAQDTGCATPSEVIAKARVAGPASVAQTRIVEAITTHETTFFRDVDPFEALKKVLLPALLEGGSGRPITIWSSACSTGQEPYSIAMAVLETFPDLPPGRIRIVATDLSSQVVEKAKEGKFRQLEMNRGLPAAFALRYFDRVGAVWQIKDKVKQLITFRQQNLLDVWTGMAAVDVVFMRYVLIYFDVPTKRQILNRLSKVLSPKGVLLLGGTETTINVADNWDRVTFGKTSYYRVKP
jgi:chemotaxis protein methyltransferase CheR